MFFHGCTYCSQKRTYLTRGELKILSTTKQEKTMGALITRPQVLKLTLESQRSLRARSTKWVKDYSQVRSFLYPFSGPKFKYLVIVLRTQIRVD